MYMKKPYSCINVQTLWSEVSNVFQKVCNILANDDVKECSTLGNLNIRGLKGLQESPIHVFLLFPTEQVYNAIRSETAVTSTCNAHDPGYVARL